MIFLDSNIVIELLNDDGSEESSRTAKALALAAREELVCDLIVVAEVAAGLEQPDRLLDSLTDLSIDVADFDSETAFRAAEAFRTYRRRGGTRDKILPDFLIAAHAERLGAQFMTRDRRLASYFPDLTLITFESDIG